MGFKIKNSLTGEFEKLPILTLKGEKGETGGVEEYNKVDYMGNKYETLKQANDANVEYAVKTAIGEFNYLDYDGQHITATDTIEGRSKNAILKGQTLVNLSEINKFSISGKGTEISTSLKMMKGNTFYTRIVYITKNTLTGVNDRNNVAQIIGLNVDNALFNIDRQIALNETGLVYKKCINSGDLSSKTSASHIRVFAVNTGGVLEGYEIIVEGDYTNQDIPYFTGMQSVKMPVLTTTGKNLFDKTKIIDNKYQNCNVNTGNFNISTNQNYMITDYIKVFPNTTYTKTNFDVYGAYYDQNKQPIKTMSVTSNTFTTPSNAHYVVLNFKKGIDDHENAQLELNTLSTTYEPYKSNILTVNEGVALRGIGDVKDTLNVNTGEIIKKWEETVVSGINIVMIVDVKTNTTRIRFTNPSLPLKVASKCISEHFPSTNEHGITNDDAEGIYTHSVNNTFDIRILNSKFDGTINGARSYFNSNNEKIAYQLTTPVVKTVDLSDNHVYSYKDVTHYDCSSAEGSLVPTLSVKVPTDVQATIAQQRETIRTLNSENERLNQIQEALKVSMLDSQVQLMNLSWNTDFEVFTLRESIAPKDFLLDSRIGSNINKFSQAKFIIENDCPDLEKLNSQIEYYFSKDVFSQEQFEELTDLISIVKGGNSCEY